jgi:hypothetical protein
MLLQLRLVLLVEFQTAYNSDSCNDHFPNAEIDMGEVRAIGLLAISPSGKRDCSCGPDDDADWNKLEYAVPNALHYRLVSEMQYRHTYRTLSRSGLCPLSVPFDSAPCPKRSSKPPGCERTKSHINSRKADSAIAQPASSDSTRY